MKESTNIQIINNIRKVLSRNLSHLFAKTKNTGLEKSNTRFKGYKNNNKILKNNNKYNKRTINENNEELFIIRKNNNTFSNLNSNIMINNNVITDRILRNKNNYHLNNNSNSKVKNKNLTQINRRLSNVKYIFDNFLILDNSEKKEKKNNSTMNLREPENKEFIKKENNSKTLPEKDISKKLNIDFSFEGNLTTSNIKEKTNKEIEKNESFKTKEIQSSKFSTSVASYNNFNIKNNININEYNKINNNTINKIDKNRTKLKLKKNSKNNFNTKTNKTKKEKNSEKKSEIIKKNKENEKKDDEIKIKDENNINIIENQNIKVENKKINLLKQIEMDSVFGIGDYEVKNDNQDSLFILTNNPSIHIFRNKINNCNLFIQKKHINNNIIKNNIIIKSHETLYTLLGICDGHGEQGKTISNYISNIIPNKLKNVLNSMSNEQNFENEIESNIKSIFSSTNTKLNTMQIIDTSYSGTCFCSLLITSTSIISISLGNSKAIIGCCQSEENKSNEKKFYPFNITLEHTPLTQEEKERIVENGGEVSYEKDEYNRDFGPLKIWKKNVLVPGLLTTRSFGDKEASLIGVISEPEIKYYEMKSEYKFFVVGSFGLWNFIESDECVKIIGEFYLKNDIHGGVNEIMKTVKSRWIEDKEDIIEDISIIVCFLKEEEIK